MELTMKQHDTRPNLTCTLSDGASVLDLTPGGTIVKVIGSQNSQVLFSRVVGGSSVGVVVMPWQVGDTATAGTISVEVEVTWPDQTVQTFPPDSYLVVRVVRDLG
jgi:hypothetical protein